MLDGHEKKQNDEKTFDEYEKSQAESFVLNKLDQQMAVGVIHLLYDNDMQ